MNARIAIILTIIPFCLSEYHEDLEDCKTLYKCGHIQEVGYPFWGDGRPQFCGKKAFELMCRDDKDPLIAIDGRNFSVEIINISTRTIRIARTDSWEDVCPHHFYNISLDNNSFAYHPTVKQLHVFYNCSSQVNFSVWNNFTCSNDGAQEVLEYYVDDEYLLGNGPPNLTACGVSYVVPVDESVIDGLKNNTTTVEGAWNQGFELLFHSDGLSCTACQSSNGTCGSNVTSDMFKCLCQDAPHSVSCPNHSATERDWPLKFGIGCGAAFIGIVITCIIFIFYHRRYRKNFGSSSLTSRNISSSHPSSIINFQKEGTYFGLHLFNYGELEKATNKFDSRNEVGDGGFGTVYYGKLRDGRAVAVKRLYESNYKRVEQFINEVEILTGLRHQNLVSLYGCTSRHCRELLLVYEYIPNGTVADHLHGQRAKPGALRWPTRMKIAIETASALAYLHASDIIHRDVKTNNILLDSNYSVKVADFGLSRLFPTDVTHVSTAPQGTPGYVDPEYHQCYQLTSKSDVFSFGVVLIELISSKPAVDIMRHRHEINLSNLAINKIKNHELHELVDPSIGFDSDSRLNEMITAVAELAYRCLQNVRDTRPPMDEVLEILMDIQRQHCNKEKPGEIDIPADDVVLLKRDQFQVSSD